MRISDWSSDVCSSDLDTIRFLDNDDLESFCDDLFVRMIAGMRPCLNWSRVEPITIEYARHSDKAGLLAYLIHRVNESKQSSDMTFNEMMDRNQRRVQSYRVISELVEHVDTFEPIGQAQLRERVCTDGKISWVADYLKTK